MAIDKDMAREVVCNVIEAMTEAEDFDFTQTIPSFFTDQQVDWKELSEQMTFFLQLESMDLAKEFKSNDFMQCDTVQDLINELIKRCQ